MKFQVDQVGAARKSAAVRRAKANPVAGAVKALKPSAPGKPADARLCVVVVYQDAATRAWAGRLCERVQALAGRENVHSTRWKMADLREPGVLAGAVSMAMRADVIVVALHAAEPLPLSFYVWAEAWLPHRFSARGSLVALIDLPERPKAGADRARDYLSTIAKQGRLDFLVEERKLQGETSTNQGQPLGALPDSALGVRLDERAAA